MVNIDSHGQAHGTSFPTTFARHPSGEDSFTQGRTRGTLPCGLLEQVIVRTAGAGAEDTISGRKLKLV